MMQGIMKVQSTEKPLQWVTFLITRFEDQLPVKSGPLKRKARLLISQSQACLVNVSRLKFSMVVGGLVKILQAVNATKCCSEQDLFDSQIIILDTLEQCLSQDVLTRTDEAVNAKIIIQEMCLKVLEEIYHATCGAPCPARLSKQKLYFDSVKKVLKMKITHTGKQPLLAAACIAGVKLCKAATYIDIVDSANVFFALLQSVIDCIKNFLFSPARPLFKYPTSSEIDVMIDCFVALFRLNYNNEIFRMCLNAQSAIPHQLVLVMALYRIAVQLRLSWWPKITLVYSRSNELRNMLNETITRVSQAATSVSLASGFACSGYVPLKVSQSLQKVSHLTGKLRDRASVSSTAEELSPTRKLLFWLIRLMCIEPTLFLNYHCEKKIDSDVGDFQNSTLELMNGLVSLIGNADQLPELITEVMEAILCLHQPCNILQWNPISRLSSMETFWYINSQVVFTVCQKLLHHQLRNYPDILRWLKQLLMCRNAFLASNRDICNFGASEQLCKQAALKLETICFLYLWSLDNSAAVTALSMFRLICKEMEICYSPEELPQKYMAFSCLADSNDLQTIGRVALQKSINSYLRKQTLPCVGCCQAWQDTYVYWQDFARYLKSYPKSKFDDSSQLIENLTNLLACPKTQRNVDVDSDLILKLWANMSGFLCASAASGGVSSNTLLNSSM
ncbi:unnamed protein product [Soboliphyme baturini]|uniref:Neurofibromin n=1 Tax=Soboliphyme baturini TaxID=241478 RepID=A0A183IL26_9BILA|nr:unnamed protein product [Soboliphyme baturini]